MKKLNALLHDVTIINFKVVGKLFLRYRRVSIGAIFVAILGICYLYFSQVVMYQKQVYFKVFNHQENDVQSKSFVIPNILDGGTSTYLKMPEIMAVINTYDFKTIMAESLAEEKGLDFRNPQKKDGKLLMRLEACGGNKSCRVKYLRELLPNFFRLDTESGTGRFLLTCTSHSSETTMKILLAFQKTLDKVRYKEMLLSTEKQVKQLETLIAQSRNDIAVKGGFDKVAESEFLNALISQHNDKLRNLAERLNKEKDQFSFQKIRLRESNITASTDIQGHEKLNYENYDKIKRRNVELRQNIGSLNSSSPLTRTATDEKIINQLKTELTANEKMLASMSIHKRNVALDDSFIDTQINNQTNFEFDYKVTSAKLGSLSKEYDAAKNELDKLFSRKASMDNKLVALKPDLEYLKLLESQLVSIKLKKSAVDSDVHFDVYGDEVTAFMKNSFFQISLFMFMIVGFLLFIVQIGIFLWDDRIYDEFEIEKCCGDLPIIGNAPSFD